MTVLTYSPSDVVVSIAGIHTVVGYVEGEFLKITKDTTSFRQVKSMDGEISRIYNDDDTYTMELTLAQSSMSNNFLTTLYNMDIGTRIGKFPLLVRDTKGQTNFFAGTAWINRLPDVVFSNSIEPRTWSFACSDAILTVGGNGETSALEDALLIGSSALPLFKQYGLI